MSLARSFRKLAALQLALVTATSAAFLVWVGLAAAISAWFGGGIALVNVTLLLWRREHAGRGRALSAGESIRLLYRSALERFVVVLALFAVGMGVLQLHAPALLSGFIVGQVALLLIKND